MKTTTQIIAQCFLLMSISVITACGNDTPVKTDEHFLAEKLETIKKAEAVDQIIQDAAALQRRTIDEQSE